MKSFGTETARNLFNIIRLRGPISQTQIAQMTEFSHATVSNAVRSLLKSAWIRKERSVSGSRRGRPPVLLSIEPNAAFAIGIDLGGQNLRVGLVNLAGEVVKSISEKTQPENGPEDILERVQEKVHQIIRESPVKPEEIDGIGFGLSGIIDSEKGICLFCPNLPNWLDIPVREILSKEFSMDVLVDDSVRMMALAEERYGSGKNVNNLIYISLGIGIGCAILMHGELYRGHAGLAGELGHITVTESGPVCRCGNYGCLEALASANAIVQQVQKSIKLGIHSSMSDKIDEICRNVDVKAIAQAAEAGDKLAFDILDKTGRNIGIGVATLMNLLNPGMVVLGGGIAQAGEVLLTPINQTVKKRAMGMISQKVPIQRAHIEEFAGVIGGATAIFDKIFNLNSENSCCRICGRRI